MDAGVTLSDRRWLDAGPTRTLIAALEAGGIAFRFVGGAVRDALLGRPVADVDVATPATPEAVIQALAAAGLKAVPTGIAHGTVTAVADGRPFEITTLRRDVETDGRHATVAFTDDWRADAARRDFTMNALYADRDGSVTDFFAGIADARAGRVRFIGDPDQRIREDALRILRFFRFHAHYGKGEPDPSGLAACAKLAPMVDRLSGERVRTEIFKLLAAPDPAPIWRAMQAAGIVQRLLPGAERVDDLERLVSVETGLGLPADPLRRLAILFDPVNGEVAAAPKDRLKLSNPDRDHLVAVAGSAARLERVAAQAFGQALYGARPRAVRDAALIAFARTGRPDAATLADFLAFTDRWKAPRFPVTGTDLAARGVTEGPEVGRLLRAVETWWAEADFRPDRESCLAKLERLLHATGGGPTQ